MYFGIRIRSSCRRRRTHNAYDEDDKTSGSEVHYWKQMPIQSPVVMVAGNALPHVVAIPFLLQGHSIPMLHLCRHLASSAGCEVTLFDLPGRQPESGCDDRSPVRLEKLPFRAWPQGKELESMVDYLKEFQNLGSAVLETLVDLSSSEGRLPRISCVVSDVLVGWGKDVAAGLGVPWIALWTSTAAELLAYYHIPRLISEQAIPPKGSKSTVSIPGLPALTLEEYATFEKAADPEFPWKFIVDIFVNVVQLIPQADRVLLNSAHDLEGPAIDSLSSAATVCPVGPLHMLLAKNNKNNEGDDVIMEWLDGQAPCSVLYVAFGTTVPMPAGQVEELALAIEASHVPFLWALRILPVPPLPPAFAERTRDRGLLVDWAPQSRVLRHPSVGGFLTHCGWNSVLESVAAGVPMIARPIIPDQVLTSKFLVEDWGIAVGLTLSAATGGFTGVASKSEVEWAIKELMGAAGEQHLGRRVRIKASELGTLVRRAMDGDGGSSYANVESLVDDLHRWQRATLE